MAQSKAVGVQTRKYETQGPSGDMTNGVNIVNSGRFKAVPDSGTVLGWQRTTPLELEVTPPRSYRTGQV